jgi:hypothetical protein
MMSPGCIAELCRRQAWIASRNKLLPLIVEAEDKQSGDRLAHHLRGIPNIGSYRPKGWTLVGTHFVDKTGSGHRTEPALTFVQFLGAVQAGMGYAIIEEGLFQVVIGEFAWRRP